jgi:hypothetical protein
MGASLSRTEHARPYECGEHDAREFRRYAGDEKVKYGLQKDRGGVD